jgi:predicted MPP superfamily phosphohydrolase
MVRSAVFSVAGNREGRVFAGVFVLGYLYAVARLWAAFPGRLVARGLIALVLLASQYHAALPFLYGSFVSPEASTWVLILFGGIFGAFVVLCFLLVALDGVLLAHWCAARLGVWKDGLPGRQGITVGLCFLALGLGAYGTWQGIRVPAVRKVEVTIPTLPPPLDGLRIVQIADLHASALLRAPWVRAVVERANGLGADLIVLTGEQIDWTPQDRAEDIRPLADLRAPLGIYAIAGNHEYTAEFRQWMAVQQGLGFRMLQNEHQVILARGVRLTVAGLTDFAADWQGLPDPDLSRALAGAPPEVPVILLAHRPGDARETARAHMESERQPRVVLQLSGHTHGGQVLGIDQLFKAINDGFVSGLYQVGPMALYVSNGTGLWSAFIIRLGVPSEITEVTLRAEK